MWRHPRNTSLLCRVIRSVKKSRRSYAEEVTPTPTPPPPSKSAAGTVLKLLGLTSLGLGGTVGYAWYDDSFRRTIEDNVPYSSDALTYIFSVLPTDSPGPESAVVMPSFGASQKSPPLPGAKKVKKLDAPESIDEVKSFTNKQTEKETKREFSVTPPLLPSKQELERQMEEEAATAQVENAALEQITQELMTSCEVVATQATERNNEAVEAINMHKEQVKKAMKSGTESGDWESVSKALDQKKSLVRDAEKAADDARREFEKLSHLLTDGRENVHTRNNPVIISGQSRLNKLQYKLDSARTERQKAETSLTMLSEFKDLIDKGRKQFQKELDSIMPDASVGKKGKRLTEDELNALIAHAHRRIEQLQIRLAEQEALEEERLNVALIRQREEDDQLTERVVEQEIERERGEQEIHRQEWESGVYSEMESRLRQELSRQAAAHNDHLSDVLRVQRRELDQQYREDLREAVLQEQVRFNNDISDSMARLKGIETAVDARAQMERTGRKAQELWLACQTLVSSLTSDESHHQVAVADDVRAVREAGNGHEFVETLVGSIPDEVMTSGVQTESMLAERFKKVKVVCRRVSMVDETGGSLLRYLVSYLQSVFVINRARDIGPDDDVTIDDLNTFTILAQAERYLNEGDLELAVRFMRQLTGEPRLVARDWLRDALLLLETRQAADVLLGHASACGLGSLCSAFSKETKKCCH